MAPVRGTRPKEGRNPATPFVRAGDVIDPLVSDPIPNATQPDATAEPGPADDPLAPRVLLPPAIALRQGAEGELGHENGPRFVEALHDGGVVVEHLILIEARAPRGGIALYGEQILCAPGNSVQRTAILAARNLRVHVAGLLARALFREIHHKVQLRVVALETREIHLSQLGRLHFSRTDQLRQLRHGGVRQLVDAAGTGHDRHAAAHHRRLGLVRELLSRRHGIEDDRRQDTLIERFAMQASDVRAHLGEPAEHCLPLLVAERETRDLLGLGDGLGRDRRALLLRLAAGGIELCPEDARHEGRAQADGAEVGHEGPSVEFRIGHLDAVDAVKVGCGRLV
jgi:hypothetical protein